MKSAMMANPSSLQDGSLEGKYQNQIQENFHINEEIRRKDMEITKLEEKCRTLQDVLRKERKFFESERNEWANFKDDLLLVVRAADNYKTEAVLAVEKYKTENSTLLAKIGWLEKILASDSCRTSIAMTDPPQPLSGNKANTLDMASPSDENTFDIVDASSSILPPPPSEISTLIPTTTRFENNKENVDHDNGPVSKENHEIIISQNGGSLKRFNGAASLNSNKIIENEILQDKDPFLNFMKVSGGSKRNALLRWCQSKTKGYNYVDITNFSTSWCDGMALNALLHSYLPDKIPYEKLRPENSRENFQLAFRVAEAAAIPTLLTIEDMLSHDRPSWEKVMNYVKDIYSTLESCD